MVNLEKTFKKGVAGCITGSELLKIALDKVTEGQNIFGGRFVYLEYEDNCKVKEFYFDNRFGEFGRRNLEPEAG